MKKLTRQELRDTQIRVLDEIDRFCKANNIKYMLAYGTLIGAIRHKGFIPWDDDVDVMMSRPEYEKFVHLYKETEEFGLKTNDNDPLYQFNFGRLYDKHTYNLIFEGKRQSYGVCIDIYPMDGAPDAEDEFQKQICDLRKLTKQRDIVYKIIALSYSKGIPFISKIVQSILSSIIKKRENVIQRYNYESCKYCSCISSSGIFRHVKKNIEETDCLPFEGKEYMVPKGYDAFLREYYGDYMKLPPEEQRIPYHGGNYYWK